MCITSAILLAPATARAQPTETQVAAAAQLYFDGKALTARTALSELLAKPEAQAPAARLTVLAALLDVCLHSYADACLAEYAPQYAELAIRTPAANAALTAEQARQAAYYLDAARLRLGRPEVTAKIMAGQSWAHENAYDGGLYLRRRTLAADVRLAQGRPADALREADRSLSLLASLSDPQADRFDVACALSEAIRTLLDVGQTERAYGLYRAGGVFVRTALGSRTVDAAVWRLAEARVLEAVGDVAGASRALAEGVGIVRAIELDADTRGWLLARMLGAQAVTCALQSDLPCARAAVAEHPAAALYRTAGRAPQSTDELDYLAARALVAALDGAPDPIAAQALSAPLGFAPDAREAAGVEAARAAGRALALAPGPERLAAAGELGRRLRQAAGQGGGVAGAGYRPGAVDQLLIALALTGASRPGADPDTAFALFQLASRSGPSFDADALSVLAQARDPLQRRAIHEVLRLRARRDRLERDMIADVARRAARPGPASAVLRHDPAARGVLRDYGRRIDQAQAQLKAEGVVLSGANIAPLDRFQKALRPDEAALVTAPAPGGLAYMCVRRDSVFRATAPADARRLQLDTRLLQGALSATYAPDETLDTQFPAAAAVRLYDALIRPFEPCLKDGDRIVWLPAVATLGGVPLAALLPQAPPRAGEGYDLAQADWLARRHAVSYAGSAGAVVAARSGAAPAPFDFLGVGDPVLTGQTQDGQVRGRVVLRGVRGGARFGDLAPLPETRDELLASAAGFRNARLLMGEDATERRFRSELTGGYRLISFATHGLLRDELEGLSEPALVLTPVSARDPGDDGLLTASEIADLNLSARFVALSACNTANFDLGQASQDLPALASAFAVAGTPATLATLWPVNSETGRRVVAEAFARLRADPAAAPAQALAEAQRAFLAAPPGRAYLHPRFWAPFVILGDAGRPPESEGGLRVTSIEPLPGGEALSVRRGPSGVLTRFSGTADATGRRGAALSLSGSWRQQTPGGASPFMARLGGRLVAAGYEQADGGPFVPRLQAFDPRTGALVQAWRGDAHGADLSAVLAGAGTGADAAVIVTGEVVRRDGAAHAVRVLALDSRLAPRLLFETQAPTGAGVDAATITPVGGGLLLLTFTARFAPLATRALDSLDDDDPPPCISEPVTWIELRDARNGALKASREVRGLGVNAAVAHGRDVWLGGAAQSGCAEGRAVVQALDLRLQTRPLYEDASLGESAVWSLSPTKAGQVFVAAGKRSVLDFRRVDAALPLTAKRPLGAGGMVFTLASDGRSSAPRLLESAGDVFVNGADAGRPDDILLAGAIGGGAVVFHLALEPPAARNP